MDMLILILIRACSCKDNMLCTKERKVQELPFYKLETSGSADGWVLTVAAQ